ncbi:TetR/AcrR family transcriptional regulator [Amycolatopsis sp.]|uniref:TetR/AcrR family transcriptional regulator n=1 Tax=Amycolatopsis sp. TaxID=37632 RepID=UPI002E019C73|nr:TetR/AcrR family transcriptional regulator [Amycolatopsis sp.]
MRHEEAKIRLLETAEELFYARGVHAVGMDAIRTHSGVSLKRLYQCFPSKEALVEAYLLRRDERWRGRLADYVTSHAETSEDAIPAVFDWLHTWFCEPGFRGCAFVNSFGELGPTAPGVAAAVRLHKELVHAYLLGLTGAVAVKNPEELADQLLSLVDGATVIAAISGEPAAALPSKAAAVTLLTAQLQPV